MPESDTPGRVVARHGAKRHGARLGRVIANLCFVHEALADQALVIEDEVLRLLLREHAARGCSPVRRVDFAVTDLIAKIHGL